MCFRTTSKDIIVGVLSSENPINGHGFSERRKMELFFLILSEQFDSVYELEQINIYLGRFIDSTKLGIILVDKRSRDPTNYVKSTAFEVWKGYIITDDFDISVLDAVFSVFGMNGVKQLWNYLNSCTMWHGIFL